MKLIFLGSGSAFTMCDRNYHSNVLLEDNDQHLLIDAGSDLRFSLSEQHYTYSDIDNIFVTHLHSDHIGGLEWLGFSRKFNNQGKLIKLYIMDTLKDLLWQNTLSGGMNCLDNVKAELSSYFDLYVLHENKDFYWSNIKFTPVKTIHTYSNNTLNPSYGLFMDLNGPKIFYTSDTRFVPDNYTKYYQEADVIFHDCETQEPASGVHASYKDLLLLNNDIKKKMWLYHYNPGKRPNAKKDGFRGFVKKGQKFEF